MVSNGIRVYMTCPPEGYCPRRHFSIRSIDKIRSLGDLFLSLSFFPPGGDTKPTATDSRVGGVSRGPLHGRRRAALLLHTATR